MPFSRETSEPERDAFRDQKAHSRDDAIKTAASVGAALGTGRKGGLMQKIALARIAITLIRRYPVPALCIAGAGIVLLMASRHARTRALRY